MAFVMGWYLSAAIVDFFFHLTPRIGVLALAALGMVHRTSLDARNVYMFTDRKLYRERHSMICNGKQLRAPLFEQYARQNIDLPGYFLAAPLLERGKCFTAAVEARVRKRHH
jgi:hypothetical protein